MKRAAILLAGVLVLTGCASTDPYDTAWQACLDLNREVYPTGLLNAETGRTLTADEICHSTIAAQGRPWFIEFYNDPERVAVYKKGLSH